MTMTSIKRAAAILGAGLCTAALAAPAVASPPGHAGPPGQEGELPPGLAEQDTLRSWAPDDLRIGTAAAGGGHHGNQDYPEPFPNDAEYRDFLAAQFSSLTPENQMKWDALRPDADTFDFAAADEVVAFAADNGQHVRGHALMWHSQNPAWLEEGDFTAEELRDILRTHIHTVVDRYAGQVQQWDVANEIFDDNAELRMQDNIWLRELGPEVIADVFHWAHEADPDALLFFNDYNVEGTNEKADAYYDLIQDLLAEGVPVHGFGIQGHLGLMYGFDGRLQENLERFDALGLQTAITEMDVRGYVDDEGRLSPELLEQQADWYSQGLQACLNVTGCTSFTVWGVLDEHSWVPATFEGQGGALLLEGDYERKPAFCAVQQTLVQTNPGGHARWNNHPALAECRTMLG
ncbi:MULTISPECIES: endo-1,4-beta-xylanase [unclassified Pseudactinotalea]|uniref:endo-1,4-beta-xylanase n=1 Tax=unclassified Pseudactinotalea TaxID=2649176 RepID=UPI003C7D706E